VLAAVAFDLLYGAGREAMAALDSTGRQLLALAPGPGAAGPRQCPFGGSLTRGSDPSDVPNAPAGAAIVLLPSACGLSEDRRISGRVTIVPPSVEALQTFPGGSVEQVQLAARGVVIASASDSLELDGDLLVEHTNAGRGTGTMMSGGKFRFKLSGRNQARDFSLTDYEHYGGSVFVGKMIRATVETRNQRLGSGLWRYQLSTPEPMISVRGTLQVAGRASTLQLSLNFPLLCSSCSFGAEDPSSVFTLNIDADADGVFEYSRPDVTRPELQSLL
jgi:hypothetical protein